MFSNTKATLEVGFDITHYPESVIDLHANEIIFGDLHANAIKFVFLLLKYGLVNGLDKIGRAHV